MRLIDADALVQELGKLQVPTTSEFFIVSQCVRKVNDAPTVDIKTEVAREIFDKAIDMISLRYLDEDDYTFGELIYDLNELKNKYTKEGVGE